MAIDISKLQLPKASHHAQQALQLLAEKTPDARGLQSEIMKDPMLAGTIIRYANSPLYRRSNTVNNVPNAIMVIGLKGLKSALVVATMRAILGADTAASQRILGHMMDISGICKIIATKACPQLQDDMEYLGLIHDVGMLILAANFPKEYRYIIERMQTEQIAIDVLERELFGTTHDQVGDLATASFRLSEPYRKVLGELHQAKDHVAGQATGFNVLCLAHLVYNGISPEQGLRETLPYTLEDTCRNLQLDDTMLSQIQEQAQSVVGYQL